jgi:hypothetical protein
MSDVKTRSQRTHRLPLTLDELIPDRLTDILQAHYPGSVVEGVEVVELIQGHTTKVRLMLDLNRQALDAGVPRAVCLKANLTGSPLSSPVCVNEARFYGELRSRMDLPTPICYLADWDDDAEGEQGLIILEDMIARGGSFDTSARAIGVDAMTRSLTGLAKLHGNSWDHPELRQEWLQTAMAPTTATDDYWGMMETYFAAHNAIPERVAMFPKWMAEDPNRLRKAFHQLCARETADTSPLCLVHGDAHLGNSYSLPNGDRLWFDWQIVRRGRPWRDFSYFVIGSITIEDRRRAEKDLLRHYLEALASYGVSVPFEEAWDNYRRWVIWGLVGWQSNINPKEETMPPLERFCRAADDLETHSFYDI